MSAASPEAVAELGIVSLGTLPYREAWTLQETVLARRAKDACGDVALFVEHTPVYTLGRNTQEEHLGAGRQRLVAAGAEVFEVDRGGSVTFHGPGQLVCYPIIRLSDAFPLKGDPGRGDVMRYVAALEQAGIDTAARFSVAAGRRSGYTGVWVGTDKIMAIGVKLAHGITMHGTAFNVTTDLSWFDRVVPCGIPDGGVTSLAHLGADVTMDDVKPVFARALARALERFSVPVERASFSLVP